MSGLRPEINFFKKRKIVLTIFFLLNVYQVLGLAVMSVDIGSEWMKVAIVSPGVPMEIALNRESQRKTPIAVSFRDGERVFGDPALTIGVRFPEKTFMHLLDVIGKQIDNPLVDVYKKRFPYYDIKAAKDRKSIIFKHPEGMEYTAEELLAMILKQAQDIAENAAGQPIKDAVITVPAFFNQAERRAMLQAAKLSGLNVLQLINSNTAVALNYGVFRRRDFNETPTNIMFYDMGAGSTVATVVSYQLVKSKETGEVSPQMSIKGVGFDHTLGGLEMQFRLRDHFAKAFNKAKKTRNDIFENNRAMAKLFKEAGRIKKVLSANTQHNAQVESLFDDQDFKIPITRTEFEELCSDLFERVIAPVEAALRSANVDMIHIDQVILAGSGARVPKVQQLLLDYIKREELGKSLNMDESAALGAAYQAAHLSKGFKVKTFLVKDTNIFPIQVDFQREYEVDKSTQIKTVKRILFNRNNQLPLKKIMTFNRLVKDFEFYVNYGDLSFLNDFELKALGPLNISKVILTGVESAISKNMDEGTEYKGVKAHFKMDESGILSLDEVESVFERTSEQEETSESQLESAFNRLGSTLGKLFSGMSEEKEPKADNKSDPLPKEKETNGTQKEEVKDVNATKEPEKNATEVKREVKLVVIKEPITSKIEYLDLLNMEEDDVESSIKKLEDLDEGDRARLAKVKAKNSLESFIVETRDKLYQEEYEKATTEEERTEMQTKLSEASDWLEYESDDATTEIFKSKLSELKKMTRDMFERIKEHRGRPDAVKALKDMLNISQVFLGSARNMSEDDQIFTEVELKTLTTLITDTQQWLKESLAEQKALALSSSPKLTLKSIGEKIAGLDREVKYLLNKARISKPLKKKEKVKEETKVNDTKVNEAIGSNLTTEEPAKDTETQVENEIPAEIGNSAMEDIAPQLEIPGATDSTLENPDLTTIQGNITPSPDPVQQEDEHTEL